MNGSSGSADEVVTCAVANDGYFKVPSDVFTRFTSSDYVIATVSAVKESDAKLAFNNSDFRIIGAHTVTGAFFTERD